MAEGFTLDQINALPDVPSTPEGGFSLDQINQLPDAPKQNQVIRKGSLALAGLTEGLGAIPKGIQTLADMGTSTFGGRWSWPTALHGFSLTGGRSRPGCWSVTRATRPSA